MTEEEEKRGTQGNGSWREEEGEARLQDDGSREGGARMKDERLQVGQYWTGMGMKDDRENRYWT